MIFTLSPRCVKCSRTRRHHGDASYSYNVRSCAGAARTRDVGPRANPSRESDAAFDVIRSNARFIGAGRKKQRERDKNKADHC